jgi:hypothetical protein
MSKEDIEYYRITKDWQLIEGDHPDTVKSDATLYWVTVEEAEKELTIEFFDKELDQAELNKSTFKVSRIWKNRITGCWNANFKDRNDAARNESFCWNAQLRNIIDRLIELDELGSWKAFDLQEENKSLKVHLEWEKDRVKDRDEKLEGLEKEIESLREEIKELKNRNRTSRSRKKT